MVGATLVVVIEELHPKQDFSFLDRLLQMGRMARDEPTAECGYLTSSLPRRACQPGDPQPVLPSSQSA